VQVTAHAWARLALTHIVDFVSDHIIGRPMLLVDFHCFKVPDR
jgi:hypothetical protein